MAKMTVDAYTERNYNVIVIAVTIVVLGCIFMFFRDRQQKRLLQLELIHTRMDTWEDLRPQQQNTQTTNSGERIL